MNKCNPTWAKMEGRLEKTLFKEWKIKMNCRWEWVEIRGKLGNFKWNSSDEAVFVDDSPQSQQYIAE